MSMSYAQNVRCGYQKKTLKTGLTKVAKDINVA